MDHEQNDAPDSVNMEHDPTVSWEPTPEHAGLKETPGGVSGAFAWALTIEGGPRTGLTYVLGTGETVAGRGAETAIFLPDVTVSREHVRFTVSESGLSMTDLSSTNGTYTNGDRVSAGSLRENDELMIGKFHLRVSRGHG